jgi:transcriptional regulator with XRE-family HTH domain
MEDHAMNKPKTLMEKIRQDLAADPELNELFQKELAELKLAEQIQAARQSAKLSQAGLAERIGTKQAGVARMERADYTGYTVTTLAKIAAATGSRLDVRLVPIRVVDTVTGRSGREVLRDLVTVRRPTKLVGYRIATKKKK